MLELKTAKKIVIGIGDRLWSHCHKVNIAGSIRRAVREVGDMELVCQPKLVATGQVDIFSNEAEDATVNAEFARIVNSLGRVVKGKPNGRYMQIEIKNPFGGVKTVMLDLFMPQPADYYRMYAIRTGSSGYSHKVIARRWTELGWCGTSDGLRLEYQCLATMGTDHKKRWKCIAKDPELPPAWQSEKEFFDWLGIECIPPNIRYVTP